MIASMIGLSRTPNRESYGRSWWLGFLAAALLPATGGAQSEYTFSTLGASGDESSSADGTGKAAGFFNPNSVAGDAAGNIFVADTGNNTIRKITPAGVVTTIAGVAGVAGSNDGTGSAARFNSPLGLAMDDSGTIYVADGNNCTIREITAGGTVTTLAGTAGSYGSSDGTGSAASFSMPCGLAVDGAGNIYVADNWNSTIRKITLTGVVTTLAGAAGVSGSADGLGSAAQFRSPSGVAVSNSGMVYVADTYGATIRKISPDGVVTTLAGGSFGSADGAGSSAQFEFPYGMAVDGDGNVLISDQLAGTIRRMTPAGVVTTLAGFALNSGATDGIGSAASFNQPGGITVNGSGMIYVADSKNQLIRVITSAGAVTTLAGSAGCPGNADGYIANARFNGPQGVAVDAAGTVYIADSGNKRIRKVTPTQVVTIPAIFNYETQPSAVAVDGSGNLYVSDTYSRIYKINPLGVCTVLAGGIYSGSQDGTGATAGFNNPHGVAADGNGTIYVADTINNTIRKITPDGVVTTLAGISQASGSADGTGTVARFSCPQGVAVDVTGNVYVADTNNSTIRKITPAGVVATLAGSAGQGGSTDGSGTAARFCGPTSVAVDAAGNLFVADTGNHEIRMITPAGVVSTLAGQAGSTDFATGTGHTAHFSNPVGIAVGAQGYLYVTDAAYNTVLVGAIDTTPTITTQPVDLTVTETQTAVFSVGATGGYLHYQWRKNGSDIANATAASLTFANVSVSDAGTYDVVATDHLAR